MGAIQQFFATLELGDPQASKNLAMFPLFAGEPAATDYLLLDDALDGEQCEVNEVSEGGEVPHLKFINHGAKPVLLLDGEELVGAKQNRIINLTILAPACSELTIPVSCVEQGRWRYSARRFSAGRRKLFSRARARKMRDVSASLADSNERFSNQGGVWEGVREKADFLRAESATMAASDIYEQAAPRLEEYRSGLSAAPGQVGAVFCINGRVVGLDVYDSQSTMSKLFAKLVDSYSLDAMEEISQGPMPDETATPDAVIAVLNRIAAGAEERYDAIGEGQDVRVEAGDAHAAGLLVDGRFVHLAAFCEA